nr:unnamed protein product [Callosobruchus analis]
MLVTVLRLENGIQFFPVRAPFIVYGVNNMKISRDKVCISLSYSPPTATLKRKVGNLLIQRIVRRYHFNLLDEQVEDLDNTLVEGVKRRLYHQQPTLLVDDTDDDDDDDDDAVSGGDANEVSVSRISRHQVKRNKGGEASTSATAGAARVDNTSNDDAVIVNLYGGKNMEISRDKVFISLSYSPRTATLKRKFGNLPIGYMRERIDKEEDFKILDRVGRRYHFNLLDEQVAGLDNTWMEGEKRELYHQPPTLLMDDTDDDDAADTGGDANEVSVSRISRHQVKRNKGGEASTSATAAAARVDNSSNDDAVISRDKVCISLSYSPPTATLKRKVGNLLIQRIVRRYHFNLLDEQVEDLDNTLVEGVKRKLYHQQPTLLVDDTDDDDDDDDDAVSGGDANEVSVSRISRHQVKRNKGGEASTSATAGAARVDNTSNDDAVIVNLYGGKNMEISRDKVFISLSYSPRTATLKRKFGNLPIGYMRERIDKEEDFKILDRVGRRYHFNLLDEQVAGLDNTWMEGEKRELYHQPPTLLMDDTDDDDAADTGGDANEVSVSRISRHQAFKYLFLFSHPLIRCKSFGHICLTDMGYGVNNMKISRDKVFISLSYSPRTATLKRKFGNLPVRYMRERIDMEEDFKILERVGRRYNFNLLDEQGGKRRLYHQPPTLLVDDTDDDDDDTGGYVNEVNVSRLSRHQVKRNKGEAST